MSTKSDFPWRSAEGIDPELAKYIERAGKKAAAVADVSAPPTAAEFNALLASLRAAGKMES